MRFHVLGFALSAGFLASSVIVQPNTPRSTGSLTFENTGPNASQGQTLGHNKTSQADTESTKPHLRSLSPYDIASFITDSPNADLRGIWNQLGIKSLNFGGDSNSEGEEGQTDRFLTKCNGCDVETHTYELDGEPGREVLLKVSELLSESCRFLLFKQLSKQGSKPQWKLLGYIDHAFGRYRMPEHFTVHGGGKNWLVVRVQEGSGSGFALYNDRLFRVHSTGVEEILRFPSEGHISTCCYHPTRKFTTRIVNCEIHNGALAIELEFSVSYSAGIDPGVVQLWEKEQKAIYKTDPKSKRLMLDTAKSDLSEGEIDAVYAREGLSEEDFIHYNKEELTKIALGKYNERKEWLLLFLNEEGQSPEKEALLRLIKQ